MSKQFLMQYYSAIMENRASLINFYGEQSVMTYGGDTYKGIK